MNIQKINNITIQLNKFNDAYLSNKNSLNTKMLYLNIRISLYELLIDNTKDEDVIKDYYLYIRNVKRLRNRHIKTFVLDDEKYMNLYNFYSKTYDLIYSLNNVNVK